MEKISPWYWLPVGLIGFAILRSRQDDDVLGALGGAFSNAYDGIPRQLRADYQVRWPAMRVRPERIAAADVVARRMASREARYRAITDPIGVPWWWLAAVHELEHSGRFTTSMIATDPIDAPPGTPPPSGTITDAEWDDTARALLRARGLANWRDWTVTGALYQWERYNGLGYRNFDVPSPYLWSFSDQYTAGKFIRAGEFSPTTVSQQPGAAVLLRRLIDLGTTTV
jgi:lysozyme family protein